MRHKNKSNIKIAIAVIIFFLSIAAAVYFGVWMMFIRPIIGCCVAFDAGNLTAIKVGITVIECLFASTVAAIIIAIGSAISKIFLR